MEHGSVTFRAAATATAASAALPPLFRTETPISAASGWLHATQPCLQSTGERLEFQDKDMSLQSSLEEADLVPTPNLELYQIRRTGVKGHIRHVFAKKMANTGKMLFGQCKRFAEWRKTDILHRQLLRYFSRYKSKLIPQTLYYLYEFSHHFFPPGHQYSSTVSLEGGGVLSGENYQVLAADGKTIVCYHSPKPVLFSASKVSAVNTFKDNAYVLY